MDGHALSRVGYGMNPVIGSLHASVRIAGKDPNKERVAFLCVGKQQQRAMLLVLIILHASLHKSRCHVSASNDRFAYICMRMAEHGYAHAGAMQCAWVKHACI